jgi:hypothetical protein
MDDRCRKIVAVAINVNGYLFADPGARGIANPDIPIPPGKNVVVAGDQVHFARGVDDPAVLAGLAVIAGIGVESWYFVAHRDIRSGMKRSGPTLWQGSVSRF